MCSMWASVITESERSGAMKKRYPIAVLALCVLATLACNLPRGRDATQTAPPTLSASPASPESTTATPTTLAPTEPSSTATTSPDTETEEGCTLNAAFVTDVTIPDNTALTPGESFRKTWRVRNSGTCDWESGTALAIVSGEAMSAPTSVVVPPTRADATVDISVDFRAPSLPGTYRSDWRLQAPDGTRFGTIVYVKIVIPGPTDTPTPTSTPTPTPTATPTLPAACTAPDAQFAAVVSQADLLGMDVNCAVSSVRSMSGALQEFWANVEHVNPHMHYRSLMIWRSDTLKVYIVKGEDTDAFEAGVAVHDDTWVEGQPDVPDACKTMTAPTGYQLPVRGFGKVWCANEYWETIGWPALPESAVTVTVQDTDGGLLMKIAGAPAGTYFVAMDFDAQRATLTMAP